LLVPGYSEVEDPYTVVTGSVSGLLGTDDSKRDIFSGLVAGLKWALIIGLLTSAISVLIGVMYGIVSAYFGGAVDSVMQFIYQIVNSVPILPVLIVVSAIFKPSIYMLITAMVLFFWTGSVMTVRSMALQIKEETYIEAAKALGAKHSRIIFKHMVPLLIPYSFASMALSVPSAIVYESSVSLLGLGDATIVTWGQILHDAMQGAAILKGIWWWVLPPGLLIAIMGMTFAFLGFSMDKILHPKLKTR
jgi:peptide/nickel transport system permease protein